MSVNRLRRTAFGPRKTAENGQLDPPDFGHCRTNVSLDVIDTLPLEDALSDRRAELRAGKAHAAIRSTENEGES